MKGLGLDYQRAEAATATEFVKLPPGGYVCRITSATDHPNEEKPFLDLIGRNEYQGVRWFRGESFQECMYLACLADAVAEGKDLTEEQVASFREEIDRWLHRCGDAQYKLDNLLH